MRFPHGEPSPRPRGERDAAAAGRRAQGGRLAPPSARSSPALPGSLKRPWSSRYGGAGKQLPRGVGADSKWERRLHSPSALGADRWTLSPGVTGDAVAPRGVGLEGPVRRHMKYVTEHPLTSFSLRTPYRLPFGGSFEFWLWGIFSCHNYMQLYF